MSNVKIDTKGLADKIAELKVKRDQMQKIFADIKERISAVPDYWQSNTSESMLTEFNRLYKEFSTINETNNEYIRFLESIVTGDYTNKDASLSEVIDSNI